MKKRKRKYDGWSLDRRMAQTLKTDWMDDTGSAQKGYVSDFLVWKDGNLNLRWGIR